MYVEAFLHTDTSTQSNEQTLMVLSALLKCAKKETKNVLQELAEHESTSDRKILENNTPHMSHGL